MNSIPQYDVAIVGAGPVGLLLANLLAQQGISVFVGEQRPEPPPFSMAIGVTPPSLSILRTIGLDQELVQSGVPVNTGRLFEAGHELGTARFHDLPSPYPFILSVPQATTTRLLERAARTRSNVHLQRDIRFVSAEEEDASVYVAFEDVNDGRLITICARTLVGCDGHKSAIRQQLGISGPAHTYPQAWIMGDFADHSGFADEARLYFSPEGSIEAFPLPQNSRRWIVQLPRGVATNPEGFFFECMAQRIGCELSAPLLGFSVFGARRFIATHYGRGRILLCGDAAHVMSSVGGQGMNVGFGDAALLSTLIPELLSGKMSADSVVAQYTQLRRPAAVSAARRAAVSMLLGTGRGRAFSMFRRELLSRATRSERGNNWIARHFAMLTLPGATRPAHPRHQDSFA